MSALDRKVTMHYAQVCGDGAVPWAVRPSDVLAALDDEQRQAIKERLAEADPFYFHGGPVADAVVDALCGPRGEAA